MVLLDPEDVDFLLFELGGSYGRIVGELERFYAAAGDTRPEHSALVAAHVLRLVVVDDRSFREVAELVGCSKSKVARLVADIREVFPDFAAWSRADPLRSWDVGQRVDSPLTEAQNETSLESTPAGTACAPARGRR